MFKALLDKLLDWVGIGGAIAIVALTVVEWLIFDLLPDTDALSRPELVGAILVNLLGVCLVRLFWLRSGARG